MYDQYFVECVWLSKLERENSPLLAMLPRPKVELTWEKMRLDFVAKSPQPHAVWALEQRRRPWRYREGPNGRQDLLEEPTTIDPSMISFT